MFLIIKKRTLVMVLAVLLCGVAALGVGRLAVLPAMAQVEEAQEAEKFAIVMYHQITPKQKLWSKFAISDTQLEQDLAYLQSHGYHTITMTQLIAHVKNGDPLPEKPIMLTFDDGYESFYTYVVPLLEKYDMCAVLSIIGTTTDLFTKTVDHHLDYSHLNWDEVKELVQNPRVEIQNHTFDMHHNDKGRKGCRIKPGESKEAYTKALTEDLSKLQQDIKTHTGWTPNTFTYPFGSLCTEADEIIKSMGFEAALTCFEHLNTIQEGTDWLYSLGRYNRAHGKSSEDFFKKFLPD